MKTVAITLSEGQAKEFEALTAAREQTPARAFQVALALYAHASDAIRAGYQVMIATRDGVPLTRLTFRA